MRLPIFIAFSLVLHLLLSCCWWLSSFFPGPLPGGNYGGVEVTLALPADWNGSTNQPFTDQRNRQGDLGKGNGGGDNEGNGSGPDGNDPLLAVIRSRIEREKHFPEIARGTGRNGKVLVKFKINPQGEPTGLVIERPSGTEVFDQEAIETIRRASPYPAYQDTVLVWLQFSDK